MLAFCVNSEERIDLHFIWTGFETDALETLDRKEAEIVGAGFPEQFQYKSSDVQVLPTCLLILIAILWETGFAKTEALQAGSWASVHFCEVNWAHVGPSQDTRLPWFTSIQWYPPCLRAYLEVLLFKLICIDFVQALHLFCVTGVAENSLKWFAVLKSTQCLVHG